MTKINGNNKAIKSVLAKEGFTMQGEINVELIKSGGRR